jgi:hypothetical protein
MLTIRFFNRSPAMAGSLRALQGAAATTGQSNCRLPWRPQCSNTINRDPRQINPELIRLTYPDQSILIGMTKESIVTSVRGSVIGIGRERGEESGRVLIDSNQQSSVWIDRLNYMQTNMNPSLFRWREKHLLLFLGLLNHNLPLLCFHLRRRRHELVQKHRHAHL